MPGQNPNQNPNSNPTGRSPNTPIGGSSPLQPGTFPGDVPEVDAGSDPNGTPNPRAILKQDRKDLQHDAATLALLADDLKKQVDTLDTTEVLSLDLVHKTEAIEKLAHSMKMLMQER
ncbi:MAG: hypothetical protein WBF35_03170 [Candidatus Acidiferrales bacterium]